MAVDGMDQATWLHSFCLRISHRNRGDGEGAALIGNNVVSGAHKRSMKMLEDEEVHGSPLVYSGSSDASSSDDGERMNRRRRWYAPARSILLGSSNQLEELAMEGSSVDGVLRGPCARSRMGNRVLGVGIVRGGREVSPCGHRFDGGG